MAQQFTSARWRTACRRSTTTPKRPSSCSATPPRIDTIDPSGCHGVDLGFSPWLKHGWTNVSVESSHFIGIIYTYIYISHCWLYQPWLYQLINCWLATVINCCLDYLDSWNRGVKKGATAQLAEYEFIDFPKMGYSVDGWDMLHQLMGKIPL